MSVARRHQPRLLFSSFEGWTKDRIGQDILAGLTLTAITVPEQMATAKLGGFEPQIGFYAFIGATIGFVLLGANRVLTAGADSTITPIFAGTLAALAASGSVAIGSVAMTLALLVGVMLIAGGILKLGWIANLLSTPVITGFLTGIAVHIVVSQLPGIFGIARGAGDLVSQVLVIATGLSRLNPFSTAIGLGVFATMVLAERISARIPGALIGIALAALVVLAFNLESRGVAVLGALPGGLPRPALPTFDLLRQLTPLALIVTLVIMMQTATVTYSFRDSAEPEPDTDRDFLGIGAGNLVAALLGAFPIDASPPRTAVVVESGGRSQLGALVAAIIVLALVLWGRALLYHVPEAALAGVLLFVAQRLIRVGTIVKIARQAPVEGLLILLTAAAIIVLPIQIGVTIGIGLSLLDGLSKTIRTHPIELRKLPGTTVWWPPQTPREGERQKGIAVIAFQAPLLFANAEIFKRGMIERIDSHDQPLSLVVLEASGIADVDFTAAQALIEILDHCRTANIRFAVARLESARAHAAFSRFGVLDALGANRLFHSVDEAVNQLAQQQ
ncbi:MAG: SulP family inorganic anion transporter [Xanthobacteraceae bacterium]